MMINFEIFFFFFFSSTALASAILVIRSNNAIYSVLFLILVFVNMTGLLLISEIEFLSIMLIIIYVGAIAILFLFVVMMLDIHYLPQNINEKLGYLPLTFFIGFLFLIETFLILSKTFPPSFSFFYQFCSEKNYFNWIQNLDFITNTETIGQILYTYYNIFFLISGIILLIALLGAVTLTIKEKKKVNQQKIYKQLSRHSNFAVFKIH